MKLKIVLKVAYKTARQIPVKRSICAESDFSFLIFRRL